MTLGKFHIWEVSTWEKFILKFPLGKMPLDKYLTSLILVLHLGVHSAPTLPCHICGALLKGEKPLRAHIKVSINFLLGKPFNISAR